MLMKPLPLHEEEVEREASNDVIHEFRCFNTFNVIADGSHMFTFPIVLFVTDVVRRMSEYVEHRQL